MVTEHLTHLYIGPCQEEGGGWRRSPNCRSSLGVCWEQLLESPERVTTPLRGGLTRWCLRTC